MVQLACRNRSDAKSRKILGIMETDCEDVNWIELGQDGIQWLALILRVYKIRAILSEI